jgi:hypothetical protein
MEAGALNAAAAGGEARARASYSRRDGAVYAATLLAAGAVLALARLLTPSPRGVGTHEQLGLPPCTFLRLTGIPCPSCGLTTSFAHAARLHFYEAFVTQPFGLLACAVTLLLIPAAALLLYRRVPLARAFPRRATSRWLGVVLALYLAAWVYKIAVMS